MCIKEDSLLNCKLSCTKISTYDHVCVIVFSTKNKKAAIFHKNNDESLPYHKHSTLLEHVTYPKMIDIYYFGRKMARIVQTLIKVRMEETIFL